MMNNSVHGYFTTSLLFFHNPKVHISTSQWQHGHESEGKETIPRTNFTTVNSFI